ncbi:MAG: AAA family ATPase, partial [Ruminococcus sp.]|nr:AAA family ATPase [Ruminococcus sp.]
MDNKNNKNNPRNNRQGWGVILFTTLLTLFIVMGLYSLMQDRDPEEISYDKFLGLVDEGKVEKVTLGSSRIYITLKEGVNKEEEKKEGKDSQD